MTWSCTACTSRPTWTRSCTRSPAWPTTRRAGACVTRPGPRRRCSRRYGEPTWFRLGDRDLATHIARTTAAGGGRAPDRCHGDAGARPGRARPTLLPMTDDRRPDPGAYRRRLARLPGLLRHAAATPTTCSSCASTAPTGRAPRTRSCRDRGRGRDRRCAVQPVPERGADPVSWRHLRRAAGRRRRRSWASARSSAARQCAGRRRRSCARSAANRARPASRGTTRETWPDLLDVLLIDDVDAAEAGAVLADRHPPARDGHADRARKGKAPARPGDPGARRRPFRRS